MGITGKHQGLNLDSTRNLRGSHIKVVELALLPDLFVYKHKGFFCPNYASTDFRATHGVPSASGMTPLEVLCNTV